MVEARKRIITERRMRLEMDHSLIRKLLRDCQVALQQREYLESLVHMSQLRMELLLVVLERMRFCLIQKSCSNFCGLWGV